MLKPFLKAKHHSSIGCGRRPPWTSLKFLLEAFITLTKSFYRVQGRFFQKEPLASGGKVLLLLGMAVWCILSTTRIKEVSNFNYEKDDRFRKYIPVVKYTRQVLKKGDVFLGPEIGIIGYFLEDAVIRDLNGIASPDVTVKNINKWSYFVDRYSPRFLFFPPGNPHRDLMEHIDTDDGVYVYQKGFEGRSIEEGGESIFLLHRRNSFSHYSP